MQLKQIEQFVRHFPDATVVVDMKGIVVAANAKIEDATGFTQSHILGQPIEASFIDRDHFLRLCRRSPHPLPGVLSTVSTPSVRLRCEGSVLVDNDGRPKWVMLRLRRVGQSVVPFSVLNEKIDKLNREIASRKAVEQALREQVRFTQFGRDVSLALSRGGPSQLMLHQCARLLTDHLGDVHAQIWVTDGTDHQLHLNAAAGTYLSVDEQNIPPEDFCIDFVYHSLRPLRCDHLRDDPYWRDQPCVAKGKFQSFAGYPLIVDGSPLGVLAVFSRQTLTDGSIKSMESVATSIAIGIERKRVEQKVQQHAMQLERAGRRKDEFLAMLAHELRNPLAPIRSGLDLLQMDQEGNDTIRLMQQQVEQMVRLVDDLLDVSRLVQGKIRLKRATVRLQDVIERAVETCKHAIVSRDHKLVTLLPEEPVWVNWDEVRMSQVITNLLNNAAKYTPDGGRIELTVSVVDDGVEIIVQDDGVGLDSEFIDEIFDIFAQADRSLARDQGGLGVGLTLVKTLVEMHGGNIAASSEGADRGSQFTIRIPDCVYDHHCITAPPHPTVATVPPLESAYRVLVVDDVAGSAQILKRILVRNWQLDVEVAYDGEMAIERAREFRPDLIFLDIGLPVLDGFEVASRLRREPGFQKTVLVALTGYAREEDRERSRCAGFDLHLAKPVSLAQIQVVIGELVRRCGASATDRVTAS